MHPTRAPHGTAYCQQASTPARAARGQGIVTPEALLQARAYHVEDDVRKGHLQDGQTVDARLVDGNLCIRSCLPEPQDECNAKNVLARGPTRPPYLQAIVGVLQVLHLGTVGAISETSMISHGLAPQPSIDAAAQLPVSGLGYKLVG